MPPHCLADKPREDIRRHRLDQKPYWHVERPGSATTRKVPVELIVNGQAVETQNIAADGNIHDLTFDYTPEQSSWVALRIFPSAHTNPVFVEVDGKPIRASSRAPSGAWTRSMSAGKRRPARSVPTSSRPPQRPTSMPGNFIEKSLRRAKPNEPELSGAS